jgi:hypothetical protein
MRIEVIAIVSCAAAPLLSSAAEPGPSYADPVAYCAAVGTIDHPDARYTGEAVPDWMARSLIQATGASPTAPLSVFRHAEWRCAEGRVMACSYGANIPCDQKADTRRRPSQGSRAFCAEHPGAGVIPAYATGHATIYEWRCKGIEPVIARQVLQVDAQGYPAPFWHDVGSLGH